MLTPRALLLWVGPKHSGKTSAAARLARAARSRGFVVAGCLAPSVYLSGRLAGFDIIALGRGRRASLARREVEQGSERGFRFLAEGLELGRKALSPRAAGNADLVIIDEYGPLELNSQGWRAATDRLMSTTGAVILLVVREELADKVRQLYAGILTRTLRAREQESIREVLTILENNRRARPYK